mgnify:CR=1 FL=1
MDKQLKQELKEVLKVVKQIKRKQNNLLIKHERDNFCWLSTNKGEKESRELDYLDEMIRYATYIIKSKCEFDK